MSNLGQYYILRVTYNSIIYNFSGIQSRDLGPSPRFPANPNHEDIIEVLNIKLRIIVGVLIVMLKVRIRYRPNMK